jgi:hypothetical protein
VDASAAIEAVRQWVELALPVLDAVVRERQPGKPELPYATVDLASAGKLSAMPHRDTTDNVVAAPPYDHEQVITEPRQGTARITFYTDDDNQGSDLGEQLRLSLEDPAIQKAVRFSGIAVRQLGDVISTAAFRSVIWEAAAQVDYAVNYLGETSVNVPIIETDNITIDITGGP